MEEDSQAVAEHLTGLNQSESCYLHQTEKQRRMVMLLLSVLNCSSSCRNILARSSYVLATFFFFLI